MAIEAELADGRILEFPDGTDPKVIQSAVKRMMGAGETTIGGQAKELVKGVIPGAIGLLETAGVGAAALLPEEYEKPTREFIKEAAATGRKPFEAAPGYEESVGRKFGEGIGSTGPFFLMGPAGVAGRLAGTGLGVAAGAGEARLGAEAKGATAEERRTATQLGAPVGLFDLLAPQIGPLKGMITTALARGGVEGATEAAQKIAQNLIAKGVYDPSQDVLAGSAEEGAYGAGVGALTSLIIDMALGRKGTSAGTKPPAAKPEAPIAQPEQPAGLPPEQPLVPVSETPTPTGGAPLPLAPVPDVPIPEADLTPDFLAALKDYDKGLPDTSLDVFARLQNRDRATPASIQQMQGISSKPDYDRLKTSSDFGNGAPVVMSDIRLPENQMGRTEIVTASDGRKIPVQYAVVDAGDLMTSHSADGLSNPSYADMNNQGIRAVAGNGRIAGLQAAYSGDTAQQYRQDLEKDKQHGIDPNAINGIENPVLVRVMPKSFVTQDIGDVSNVSGSLRLNPVETAANDSSRFDINGINFRDDGSFDKDSLIQFVRAMPKEEQGELMDGNGMPNTKAIDRLNNAIFHRAYGSPSLIDLYAQAADPEAKLILQAMARSASKAANLEGAGEYDIRKNIVDAAELAVNSRRQGVKLKDYVNQGDIGMDPNTRAVLDMFAENSRSGKRMGELLSKLADAAAEQANAGVDMFGNKPQMSLDDVFKTLKEAPAEPEDLFTKKEEKPAESKIFESTKPDTQIEQELTGLDIHGACQWLIDNAPNSVAKYIAEKLAKRIRALTNAGVPITFKVLPNVVRNATGMSTGSTVGGKYYNDLTINGAGSTDTRGRPNSGSNYKTLMHEMLHTATQPQFWIMGKIAKKEGGEQSKLFKELSPLLTKIRGQINKDIKEGKSHPFLENHKRILANGRKNQQLKNVSELVSYGLTEEVFQDYLKTVKVAKNQSAFSKLVDLFRQLLNIDTQYQSALEQLASVTEAGLDVPVSEIQAATKKAGYTVGKKEIQEASEKITRLPAFKRWFAGSKVVDANGKPMVMYHGTAKDFKKFDAAKLGDNTRDEAGELGFFFTAKPFLSDNYAEIASRGGWAGKTAKGEPVVYPVYLSLQNPKFYKTATDFYRDAELHKGRLNEWRAELQTQGFDGVIVRGDFEEVIAFEPTQIKSVFNKGTFSPDSELIEESLPFFGGKKEGPTPKGAGADSLALLDSLGRGPKEADATGLAKANQAWNNAVENPQATAEAANATIKKWLDRLETWAFSSDAGLQNRIRRAIAESTLASKERIGALLNASLSQTVHSDAVASLFLRKGGIKYNDELHKWEGVDKDENFIKLSQQLDALAEKNGLTKEQAELIGHTAFEAKRYRSMLQFNAELQQKIEEIRAEAAAKRATSPVAASALSEKASRMQAQFKFVSDQQKAMIEPGMSLFKIHPELNDVVKTWNEIRANAVEAMVSTGFWSEQQAEEMLSNADYVPFYREEELGDTKDYGPKEFIRGLQTQKDKRLKGSERPVADIFDNQVRWVQYSINRAVRNRSAVALVDTAVDIGAARKVDERKGNDNVVRVWRNGEESLYSMDDPMFVEAFTGLEAIVIPSWKWASNMANTLRQTVVMYPLFSVAQVPQDSFAAVFSSGLKPQYALRIPILAVKEFIQTIRGKSSTHEQLKNVGAVGVRDFTSAMVRMDAEIYAGLKAPPGVLGKLKYGLNHIAMAADNAVRQAVYDASMAQGLTRAEAIEKSFEVFNVRRKGSSKSLALAGQVIPFFNAYLAAQNVAYKTITGRGISPTERADAFKTLLATTGSVMTLSLLYAMMNGDDDDYNKKPAVQRDRLLMIPGTGGLSIPLRNDLFTFPKIITEHMYLMMTDKGYEDGRKFRDSMANALGSALLGPTAVPQAIKPFVEVAINYDFFQGRPLVGTFQKGMETERQFNESTSELGKLFGKTGLISPIGADHIIRGMFGSAGGLVIYMTNPILFSDPNVPRPSLSDRDAIAALPGMSGFMSKSYESALKKDFFTLKEEVDKAASTLNDIKKRSPQDIQGFLSSEENVARVGLQKTVNRISENLSKIRGASARIANSDMSSEEKRVRLQDLRDMEENMLKNLDIKALRQRGML